MNIMTSKVQAASKSSRLAQMMLFFTLKMMNGPMLLTKSLTKYQLTLTKLKDHLALKYLVVLFFSAIILAITTAIS